MVALLEILTPDSGGEDEMKRLSRKVAGSLGTSLTDFAACFRIFALGAKVLSREVPLCCLDYILTTQLKAFALKAKM